MCVCVCVCVYGCVCVCVYDTKLSDGDVPVLKLLELISSTLISLTEAFRQDFFQIWNYENFRVESVLVIFRVGIMNLK